MESNLQRSVVEVWHSGNVNLYAQLHRAAVLGGDMTGAFLMSNRIWAHVKPVATDHGSLERLFYQLKESLVGDDQSDDERRAWAAYHIGTGCLSASQVETGIHWLTLCLQSSDSVEEMIKFECLLHLEEAYRGWNPQKGAEMSQQAVNIAFKLEKAEHLSVALYRLGERLGDLGFMEEKQMIVDNLLNLMRSTNLAIHHLASTLYRVCQGESALRNDHNEAAYEEFMTALNHLQYLPEMINELEMYLKLQKDGRNFWPPKCELAVEIGVRLNTRLARLREKLGKEATDREISLSQYLAASRSIFKLVNTVSLQHLRDCLNASLARNSLEDAESFAAELLKAASADEMSKYKTAAIDALQGLAIVCYRYHEAGFGDGKTAFEIIDSFLKEAEEMALASEMTSYMKLRRDRAFYNVHFKSDSDWKRVVMHDLQHILEMERRIGSVSDDRIRHLHIAREFFDDIQCRYLEWSTPQVKQALLWAERGRSRDTLHHLVVNGRADFDMTLFDFDDDWGWKELESFCCEYRDSVFLLFSRPRDESDIYSYFLYADEEPGCVKCSVTNLNKCSEMLYTILSRGRDEERRQRRGLLTLFYTILIQPWEERLELINPTRLVILPTKDLCSVPFPALRVPENKFDVPQKPTIKSLDDLAEFFKGEDGDEYLIERYEIVVAPSLRMFHYCEQRREALLRTRHDKQALLVIDPTEDLSEAEGEALDVKACLSSCGFNVRYLEKKEATKEAVAEGLMSCDWAHFATHGYLDDKYPRGSLVLAAEHDNDAGISHHERVTGVRLVHETLTAEAVVLSSCTSGIGLEMYPEGNLGLPRSFHMAGVPTCVASLWKVDDESTRILMQYFYQSLAEGACASKAMQEAMKLMIHADEDELTGDPAYDVINWACFYVSGAASSAL